MISTNEHRVMRAVRVNNESKQCSVYAAQRQTTDYQPAMLRVLPVMSRARIVALVQTVAPVSDSGSQRGRSQVRSTTLIANH